VTFHSWDVGNYGQTVLWERNKQEHASCDAIIWMIDSNITDTDEENCNFLNQYLAEYSKVPCLILSNKQDLPNARTAYEIANVFGVRPLKNDISNTLSNKVAEYLNTRPWKIQPCSVIFGDGLYDGLEWLFNSLSTKLDKEK